MYPELTQEQVNVVAAALHQIMAPQAQAMPVPTTAAAAVTV